MSTFAEHTPQIKHEPPGMTQEGAWRSGKTILRSLRPLRSVARAWGAFCKSIDVGRLKSLPVNKPQICHIDSQTSVVEARFLAEY